MSWNHPYREGREVGPGRWRVLLLWALRGALANHAALDSCLCGNGNVFLDVKLPRGRSLLWVCPYQKDALQSAFER